MDTTKTTTHIGLCAGYGGIELGLKRVIPNLRSVALCEIEAFAIANLVSKMEAGLMDPAPIWPNLRTFPWGAFRDRVDILTGGYPCQPFSSAGKRAGKEDPRHLWPWIADGVRLLRPKLCFFENVEGHISLGLSDVIEDLAGMGYRTTWGIFSASECGAPHQRKRVFILAHKLGTGLEGFGWNGDGIGQPGWKQADEGRSTGASGIYAWPSRPGEQQHGWEPPRVVADSHRLDRSAQAEGREHDRQAGPAGEELGDSKLPKSARFKQYCWESSCNQETSGLSQEPPIGNRIKKRQAQPPLGGDVDGASGGMDYSELCVSCDNRTDELRLLGNGVVPATAELAFRVLIKELYTAPAGR